MRAVRRQTSVLSKLGGEFKLQDYGPQKQHVRLLELLSHLTLISWTLTKQQERQDVFKRSIFARPAVLGLSGLGQSFAAVKRLNNRTAEVV